MYWAEIKLPERITFYTEEKLESKILTELEKMQRDWKRYKQLVVLNEEQIDVLKRKGVQVLKSKFLALKGEWHWFTGKGEHDAFRISPEVERTLEEKGLLEVRFTGDNVTMVELDFSKFDPKTTLFVVSCTKKKTWEDDPMAPEYIPARYAYKGRGFLKFLKCLEGNESEKKGYKWVILSGKYGFIEPWHPISKYDVLLGGEGSISEETLKNQVKQERWWKDGSKFKLEEFKCIVAVNCNEDYVRVLKNCFQNANVHVYNFLEDDDKNKDRDEILNRPDFLGYLNRLSDPDFLISGCTIFFKEYESNVDEVVESVWQDYLRKKEGRPKKELILGAAEIILLKWNCPFLFSDRPEDLISVLKKDRISQELEEAYSSTESKLNELIDLRLGDPELLNYLKHIESIYSEFRVKSTIGVTGAAKALHFIHPLLFVPWDTQIREHFHSHDPNHCEKHEVGDSECYAQFMKTCNEIAMRLMEKTSWEEIAKRHPAYGEFGVLRTVPKMLDECNYCRITKKKRWG